MPRKTHTIGLPIACAIAVAAALAGCGGGSPGGANAPKAANSNGSTAAKTSPANTSVSDTGPPSALAFARCMRSNGVTNFPDPNPGGGFEFHASPADISSPAFRTAQAKCQRFMPGGGPLSPGPPPSAQTMAQLRRIAVCMREHGVPQFPDPRSTPPPQSSVNLGQYREITNYMGAILLYPATIDMQSPAYTQALSACGAGFLAGQNAH
jgi:hypothetical protein